MCRVSGRVLTRASVSPPPSSVRSAADLAEAFHLAHAAATLYQLNVLDELVERPATAKSLAKQHGLDPSVLQGVLEYLAARTNIVGRKGKAFVSTPHYGAEAQFLIGLYLGAFRPNAIRLREILRNPRAGARLVDRRRHAQAFARAVRSRDSPVATVIRHLELDCVLDLGCGSADLLVQMGKQDPRFVGWGVEMNPEMCRVARARIRAAGLTRRVRVIEGDSRRLRTVVPSNVITQVTAVTACHVANEMFQSGSKMATAWLRGIRRTLPGRPVLINDYYGRLGARTRKGDRHTLLHDYAQLISGQGVPPFSFQHWHVIYGDAGYRLVHVLEDQATTQFIHVLV